MKKIFSNVFILLILFATGKIVAQNNDTIERVEPPFWWVGMENEQLQLLVYGDNVAQLSPGITYKGIEIKRVVTVDNPNYLFIYLHIGDDASAGQFDIHFSKEDKTVMTETYALKSREIFSSVREGFTSSDVIYLVTPDRFANGNFQNDNVDGYGDKADRADPTGRHGGDIQGIIDNLDYIEDMGYTALWLNPVLENVQPRTSYHGYATTDYYKVDPRFGSNEKYKELSKRAQSHGIKLIMDQIMNHCGSEHWWMKDLPSDDWINNKGEFLRTNHRRATLHDPYVSEYDREKFVDGWFVRSMPDMNQDNPLMADYLIQNSIWWIEYADLGGVRHDTHPYPGVDFMAKWTCAIMEEYPNFNIVGEEWSEEPAVIAKWQKGNDFPRDFPSCLPSMMDFPIQTSLIAALSEKESWNKGWIKLYNKISFDYLYKDPFNLVIFPDNHDMSRFYTQVGEDYNLFKMGIAYILTMRGIPQIYYGTEILMSNPGTSEHGVIRSDFPGGWNNDVVNAFTGKNLPEKQAVAQSYMKKLLNWRKDNEVIHSGDLVHFAPEDGVYTFFRYNDNKKIMVILNKNDEDVSLHGDRFAELIESYSAGKDVITGATYLLDEMLLPAKSPVILELFK